MSVRRPGYVVGVVLLAVVSTLPLILLMGTWIRFGYTNRVWPLPPIVGLHQQLRFHSQFVHRAFWQDKFIRLRWNQSANGKYDYFLSSLDPETGEIRPLELGLSGHGAFEQFSIGNRIWFVETLSKDAFEVIDGVLEKVSFVMPHTSVAADQRFLLNGKPAFVESTRSGYVVAVQENGVWDLKGILAIPDLTRERTLNGVLVRANGGKSSIQIVQSKDRIHVFVHVNGFVLYHDGLVLRTSEADNPASIADTDRNHEAVKTVAYNQTTGLLNADSQSDSDLNGWTLVCDQQSRPDFGNRCTHGLLIEGQPAALIVDRISEGCPIGCCYQFDGTAWRKVGSQPLVFGSRCFRVVNTQDGLHSYVVAMTSTGTAHFYSASHEGLRKTLAQDCEENTGLVQIMVYFVSVVLTSGLGILLGMTVSCLMWWYTRPDYQTGVQTVKLASLWRRGSARLIDLGGISLTTTGLGWLLTRGFDWLGFAEALNLRIDHPTIGQATRTSAVLVAWLFVTVMTMLVTQDIWGVTPGKLLCRLKTVRTTLCPCGFAASLAREILFFIDCGDFLCWTPGILSIAVTERRQRLGDLVADTIVVESRSLTSTL